MSSLDDRVIKLCHVVREFQRSKGNDQVEAFGVYLETFNHMCTLMEFEDLVNHFERIFNNVNLRQAMMVLDVTKLREIYRLL